MKKTCCLMVVAAAALLFISGPLFAGTWVLDGLEGENVFQLETVEGNGGALIALTDSNVFERTPVDGWRSLRIDEISAQGGDIRAIAQTPSTGSVIAGTADGRMFIGAYGSPFRRYGNVIGHQVTSIVYDARNHLFYVGTIDGVYVGYIDGTNYYVDARGRRQVYDVPCHDGLDFCWNLNGLRNIAINSIFIDEAGDTIYAGGNGAVYSKPQIETPNLQNWTRVNGELFGARVLSIARAGADGPIVLGTDRGFFSGSSEDGFERWRSPLDEVAIQKVVHDRASNTLYAATNIGFYRKAVDGDWVAVNDVDRRDAGFEGMRIFDVAVHGGRVYSGSRLGVHVLSEVRERPEGLPEEQNPGGALRPESGLGGLGLSVIELVRRVFGNGDDGGGEVRSPGVSDVIVDSGGTVVAGDVDSSGGRSPGIFPADPVESDDVPGTVVRGIKAYVPTWTQIHSFSERMVSGLFADPRQPEVLYAHVGTGLFKSRDAGRTWLPMQGGISEHAFVEIVALDRGTSTLYAAICYAFDDNQTRLFRMSGETWTDMEFPGGRITSVSAEAGLFVGTDDGEVYEYRAMHHVAVWERVEGNFFQAPVTALAVDLSLFKVYGAGTEGVLSFDIHTQGDERWWGVYPFELREEVSPTVIAMDPAWRAKGYFGTPNGLFEWSVGSRWFHRVASEVGEREIFSLARFEAGERLYAGTDRGLFIRMREGGWRPLDLHDAHGQALSEEDITAILPHEGAHRLYVGTRTGKLLVLPLDVVESQDAPQGAHGEVREIGVSIPGMDAGADSAVSQAHAPKSRPGIAPEGAGSVKGRTAAASVQEGSVRREAAGEKKAAGKASEEAFTARGASVGSANRMGATPPAKLVQGVLESDRKTKAAYERKGIQRASELRSEETKQEPRFK